MTTSETEHFDHLRKLPSGSLFDLLLDDPGRQAYGIRGILQERGYSTQELEEEYTRRSAAGAKRSYCQARRFRQLAFGFTLIIFCFNALAFLNLLESTDLLKSYLLLIMLSMLVLGLYIGLKLNTLLYLGSPTEIFCGFPCPVATIDVDTGEEQLTLQLRFYLTMLLNTLVAVNLTLFPASLASYLLL